MVAHRGGARLAPENTMVAFERAVDDFGADMLEMDVRLSRDGEVVVHHDPTVDRTTEGTGRVDDLPWSELRELDAGARFEDLDGRRSFAGRGVRIPRFEEVLLRFPTTRLNVEAKTRSVAGPLVDLVKRHGAEHRVLLAAEHERNRSHAIGMWEGPLGASRRQILHLLLTSRMPFLPLTPGIDALQIPDMHRIAGRVRRIASPRLIAEAHRRNIAVHVFTIDDAATMHRLLEWGVDAIQTDRPDRLARMLHDQTGRPLPPALRGARDRNHE